jgi:hypothetical protein
MKSALRTSKSSDPLANPLCHRAPPPHRPIVALFLLILPAWIALSADQGTQPASPAAPASASAQTDSWRKLFDGSSLTGWKVTNFAGGGEVEVDDGSILLGMGAMLTGIVHTNPVPKTDYEVVLKAMKIDGSDFFCGLTFPVQDSFCTLIAGGWGGGLVGLSSLDNYDASENESSTFRSFEKNRWYSFRLRVTQTKIEAWLDGDSLIDVSIVDRKISLRPGDIELSVPLGISAWQTRAALRDIRIRLLEPGEVGPKPSPPKS